MPHLPFISDSDLRETVLDVLRTAEAAKEASAGAGFGRNIIDPFGIVFEMAGFGLTSEEWIENERIRQAQKTLQNAIGGFHQKLISRLNGWNDPGTAGIVDAINLELKFIAEIKNKYNTVKGSDLKSVYETLENAVMFKNSKYKDYTAFYVEIIPRNATRYSIPFQPSDNQTGGRKAENPKIIKIDGYSFYDLATGQPGALENLFLVLPLVISEIAEKKVFSDKDIQIAHSFFEQAFFPKDKKVKKPKPA